MPRGGAHRRVHIHDEVSDMDVVQMGFDWCLLSPQQVVHSRREFLLTMRRCTTFQLHYQNLPGRLWAVGRESYFRAANHEMSVSSHPNKGRVDYPALPWKDLSPLFQRVWTGWGRSSPLSMRCPQCPQCPHSKCRHPEDRTIRCAEKLRGGWVFGAGPCAHHGGTWWGTPPSWVLPGPLATRVIRTATFR